MVARKVDDPVRPKIGFALGGGAVRGAAHLGFLSVFEEAGIKPDFVAGTSVGAIVGAGYTAGLTVAEMSALVNSTGWRDVTNIAWRQRLSVFDTTPLRRWIEGAMGDVDFADLQIPLSVVACNILDGRRVVLREGSVVRAAVASSAIPGLFSPEEWDGMLLVDGGLVDNLPVSAVRQMGADIVVAVDVSPSLRHGLRPDGIRDVVTAAVNIAASNTQIDARTDADYLVQPDIEKFSPWDFSMVPEIEEAGRQASQLVVGQVVAALG
ncbi:MAG: patatin-like phospholipase family protein [Actinomycetota bacterium]|jgi:NTE family protein|nr:patatin-like phospholipase family protein [Actinomycetota bacterium]